MRKYWPHHLLVLVLVLAIACYWPGLNGPFLFDDAPNLDAMGGLGGVTDWVTLKAYVMTGWSGPTGRPLSLLSFLINDNTWPSAPLGFKITNLELHLMCGLLLAWANYLLLKSTERGETDAAGVAVQRARSKGARSTLSAEVTRFVRVEGSKTTPTSRYVNEQEEIHLGAGLPRIQSVGTVSAVQDRTGAIPGPVNQTWSK